jgi:hypothetical protein
MRESDLQSRFTAWAKKNWNTTAAFELKIVKGNRMQYSRVKEHQQYALWRAKHAKLFHKISDMSLGVKPFDCFMLAEIEAYVALCYYHPHRKLQLFLIDIDTYLKAKTTLPRKSLSEEEAYEFATHHITL